MLDLTALEIRELLASGKIGKAQALEITRFQIARRKELSPIMPGRGTFKQTKDSLGIFVPPPKGFTPPTEEESYLRVCEFISKEWGHEDERLQMLESELSLKIEKRDGLKTSENTKPKQESETAPIEVHSIPTSAGSNMVRIRWMGTKTDLGRVYEILGGLVDCNSTEWEQHFMGPDGQSMTGACDLHNAKPVSKSSAVQSLASAARKMISDK